MSLSSLDNNHIQLSGGVTSYWEGATSVTSKTYFDIGSITKVVAGLSLFIRGWEKEEWDLNSTLEDKLSAFSNTGYGGGTFPITGNSSAQLDVIIIK
jgi:CubicO group peptidase (beta-lactamase class C family)